MDTFGSRLRQLRKDNGVMAKALAELLSITYRTYQMYETGQIDPPLSKAVILADFFSVSLDYLVGRSDNPSSHKL